jgi:hypothetical protein
MKLIYSLLSLSIFFVACQPKVDNSAKEAFEKNSQTVMAYLNGWQSENLDYLIYSDSLVFNDTGFGGKDSLSLDDIKKMDKEMFERFDFKLLTDPIVLLPGVNPDTKELDGSVRYYGDWQVTIPATDSTEARSASIKFYESFDFNEEGKIILQQGFGDFGGLFNHLYGENDDNGGDGEDME